MDRQIVYIGQSPEDTDILLTNKDAYIGLAKLSAAILGTSTLLNNFACTQTTIASLNVLVSQGEIYSLQNIDNTAYGSLEPDTTNQIVKQGVILTTTTLSCPAPSTVGNSINYLVEIGFSELDGGDIVLPYYDSANPNVPFTGPNNNPVPQNTIRADGVNVTVKAGVSAPTGTQVTPSPDAGFTGAYVVTVAHGQTTIVSGDIALYSGAPFITETLTQKLGIADLQSGASIYSADTGSANAYVATLTPAITAYSTGMKLSVKIANANTTTSTLNVNSLGTKTIKYTSGSNIAANDLIVGMLAQFEYDGTNFQLLNPASQDAGGILPISEGGTGVSSVTTSPTATSWAGWDANSNLSANNNLVGYATTTTAAATTILTVASKKTQFFTGSTTQTVVLPVTSTLALGHQFLIENRSSAVVTVQSSGANTIKAMEANSELLVTCILTSGTSAASWDYSYSIAQGALPVADGGTAVTSVTTAPTASSFAGWDANSNFSANRFLEGYTTTATAAGTTTLTVSSTSLQYFTGSTTQTVKMPVTSTLVLGGKFTIQNRSTGVVTVQSSGSNTIIAMEANTQAVLTCILTSGTTAASWDYSYSVVQGALPVDDGGTGVSSTTAYAVLCGGTTSTSALQSIASVGSSNNLLASNGAGALPTFKTNSTLGLITQVIKQVFTSSGTYTPTSGMVYCVVDGVAGGGGSGGCTGSIGANGITSGGGGGGGYARVVLTAAQIGASKTVTIGAGGLAGTAGNNAGGNGGSTSLSTFLVVGGGTGSSGGAASGSASTSSGGAGGTATTGDVLIPGQTGGVGIMYSPTVASFSIPGCGGHSILGFGAPSQANISSGSVGIAGLLYGGGASGSVTYNTASNTAGSAGAAGIITIIEYLSV